VEQTQASTIQSHTSHESNNPHRNGGDEKPRHYRKHQAVPVIAAAAPMTALRMMNVRRSRISFCASWSD
jgi:hypothetical protein